MGESRRSGAQMGADPATFPLPIALLRRVRVSDGTKTYLVDSVDSDFVYVAGAQWLLPVRHIRSHSAYVNVGRRVDRYLKTKVEPSKHSEVVAAATIAAAFAGYPRTGKSDRRPAGPLDRVWTDHLALVHGDRPEDAWEISSDKAPVSEHIGRLHGQVSYWLDPE
jgi:hypothetical protein